MGHSDAVKGDGAKQPPGPAPAITDSSADFEEYTAPPRLDEQGKPIARPKGLKESGYQFPPAGGPAQPLTKANLAKGIGVPEIPRVAPAVTKAEWPVPPLPGPQGPSAPSAPAPSRRQPAEAPPAAPAPARPPSVKVDEGELFEEYQAPDLKDRPRTGKGLRAEPPRAPDPPEGPKAKDILANLPEPELQVFTPKRFSPYQVRQSEEHRTEAERHAEHERAALDVAADLAVHRKWLESATMSSPTQGPIRAVIHDAHGEVVPMQEPTPSPIPPSNPLPISPEPTMDTTLPHGAELASSAPTTMSNAPAIPSPRPVQAPYVPPPPAVVTTPTPRVAPTPQPQATGGHQSGAPPTPAGGDVPRIGLVQSDFHYDVTTRMAQAAQEKARMLGAPIVHHVHVAGAFDIPLATKALLERGDVDAVVCVGAIVQGETGHDTLIARECARLLADLALEHRKPVGLGVTGPAMTRDQAFARVAAGAHAVDAVIRQHRVLRQVRA